jgi:16S rRNA (cytidine1402-2'-O)-methyltransferase
MANLNIYRPAPLELEPGLYIVSTPIGNLRDITLRALDTLHCVNTIYAEDTRMTSRLLASYGIKTAMAAYHDHNGEKVRPEILARLAEGATLALVSDAGTPLISDPGYKLVRDAARAGHNVYPVPGACAALAALSVAGLPSDRFHFIGFLPAKQKARRTALQELSGIDATLILYESALRTPQTLADIATELGSREVVMARELTKKFETVWRGSAQALAMRATTEEILGEVVLLIGPPASNPDLWDEAAIRAAIARDAGRTPPGDLAREIADLSGWQKRAVYQLTLEAKGDDAEGPRNRRGATPPSQP